MEECCQAIVIITYYCCIECNIHQHLLLQGGTMAKPLLGEILVEDAVITKEQLNEALAIQKRDGGLIGIILMNLGYINEPTLVKYLALQAERVIKSE